jgi:two-component system, LuxR family, sensor kinase FixL
LEQLPSVVEKIVAESERAGEVVKRLRDFSVPGTTRLEPVQISELIAAAQKIGRQLIGARLISIDVKGDPGLPFLFVDRLQIELVLVRILRLSTSNPGHKHPE